MRSKRAPLPEFVVDRMLEIVVPERVGVFQIFFVAVRERTHPQVEIVGVGRSEIEWSELRRRTRRIALSGFEAAIETEVRGQIKRTVVIRIVTVADVTHGSL